jgi:predicted alpha/beta hydrolase family esterase
MTARSNQPRFSLLNVPGLGGSGPLHWQTAWEEALPGLGRVEQDDWDRPERRAWVRRLTESVNASEGQVVVVAHSLGCGTVVHAAAQGLLDKVAGAFLVAMPDMERDDFPPQCQGFSPVPRIRLPFPSLMVGSRNDPFIGIDALLEWAVVLGSEFVDVGNRHHIGSAAGLGDWLEGRVLFERFLSELPTGDV